MTRSPLRIEFAPCNWTLGIEWKVIPSWAASHTRVTVYLCFFPFIIIFEHYYKWSEERKKDQLEQMANTISEEHDD